MSSIDLAAALDDCDEISSIRVPKRAVSITRGIEHGCCVRQSLELHKNNQSVAAIKIGLAPDVSSEVECRS